MVQQAEREDDPSSHYSEPPLIGNHDSPEDMRIEALPDRSPNNEIES